MSTLFVTAIGTDCGKTHVGAALLRELTRQGRPALAIKPLMTGFDPARLGDTDAGRLLTALGRPATAEEIDAICWKRFPDWTAPNVAARNAGVALSYDELLGFVRSCLTGFTGDALVEGAGGVMSPLTDEKTNIDLALDLGAPVLLLASNYLGAVSHTLTALEALQRRGIDVKAVVVTQALPNAGLAAPFAEELRRWTGVEISEASFSRGPDDDRVWAAPLAEKLFG